MKLEKYYTNSSESLGFIRQIILDDSHTFPKEYDKNNIKNALAEQNCHYFRDSKIHNGIVNIIIACNINYIYVFVRG